NTLIVLFLFEERPNVIACLRKKMEDCLESLRDANVVARCTAVRALGQMGASAREALPALIQSLQDREAMVRDAAAEAIGAIGPETREAVAALHQALADSNSFVQAAAAKALKKADVYQTVPVSS